MAVTRRQSALPKAKTPKVEPSDEGDFVPGVTEIRFAEEEQERLEKLLQGDETPTYRPRPIRPIQTKKHGRRWWPWLLLLLAYASFVSPTSKEALLSVERGFKTITTCIDDMGAPYVARLEPYYTPIQPHLQRADAILTHAASTATQRLKPHAHKYATRAYSVAEPYVAQVDQAYQQHLEPHVNHYHKIGSSLYALNVSPRLTEARKLIEQHSKTGGILLDQYSRKAALVLRHHYAATKTQHIPAAHQWYQTQAKPAALRSYAEAQRLSATYVIPTKDVLRSLLLNHVWPHIRRFHSLYITPQMDRVKDKFFEYKTHKVANQAAANLTTRADQVTADDQELDDFIEELQSELLEPEPTQAAEEASAPVATSTPEKDHAKEAALAAAKEERRIRERARIVALHDEYTQELSTLAEREQALLQERLNGLRSSAASDIDYRFRSRVQDLKDGAGKYHSQFSRYFGRLASKQKDGKALDLAATQAEATALGDKAAKKFAGRVDAVLDEVEEYQRSHGVREAAAAERAADSLSSFVGTAQEKLGHEYTWMDDVSPKDWTRFHEIGKTEQHWLGVYRSLLGRSKVETKLAALDKELNDLIEEFEEGLAEIEKKGIAALQPPNAVSQGLKDAAGQVGDAYVKVVDQAKEGAEAVSRSVVVALGGTPTPTDIAGSASSAYAQATDSAASVLSQGAQVVASVIPAPVQAAAAHVYDQVAQGYAGAVDGASSLVDQVGDAVHTATRSLASAAPSSEAIFDHAESVIATLSTQVVHAPIVISDGLWSQASDAIGSSAASAASVYQEASQSQSIEQEQTLSGSLESARSEVTHGATETAVGVAPLPIAERRDLPTASSEEPKPTATPAQDATSYEDSSLLSIDQSALSPSNVHEAYSSVASGAAPKGEL